jgi:hypothetical protein
VWDGARIYVVDSSRAVNPMRRANLHVLNAPPHERSRPLIVGSFARPAATSRPRRRRAPRGRFVPVTDSHPPALCPKRFRPVTYEGAPTQPGPAGGSHVPTIWMHQGLYTRARCRHCDYVVEPQTQYGRVLNTRDQANDMPQSGASHQPVPDVP